jgi:putative transposon-encoded protein
MTHSEIEGLIRSKGWEVLRRLMEGHVQLRGVGEVDGDAVVGADKIDRSHRRLHDRILTTLFGPIEVCRQGYGQRGTRSLHPLDADLNLPPEEYSHGVRRLVAEQVANVSFDKTVEQIGKNTGASVPKRQVEELTVRAAKDFEVFYQERKAASAREARQTGAINVLTADGKGVVVHKEDLREATRKEVEKRAAEQEAQFSLGLPKPPEAMREGRKRMATVASTYTIAPFVRRPEDVIGELNRVRLVAAKRPRPENKRVWASVVKGPEAIVPDAFADALRRDPKRDKRWVAVVDGNETQMDIIAREAKRLGIMPTLILDFLHVAQYVWTAGHALLGHGTEDVAEWVRKHLLEILRGRSSLVAAGMRRSATKRELSASARAPVDDCANYLLKYAGLLRYNEYLADGLPIASGVIEGACRYLVGDRMGITGAIWGLESAEAVLQLRSLHASEDFDDYWHFHERRERERNHASQYEGGTIPAIKRPAPRPTKKRAQARHLRAVS